MQEYQSPVRVYKHPFELIMAVSSAVLYDYVSVFICVQEKFAEICL